MTGVPVLWKSVELSASFCVGSARDSISKSTNAKRPEGFVVYRFGKSEQKKVILVILSLSVDCCVEDLLLSTSLAHCEDLVALRIKDPL